MVVILDPIAPANPIANHRPGPDAALIAADLRSGLDGGRQPGQLLVGQARRWSRRLARLESFGPPGIEPLQPAIDRPTRYAERLGDVDDSLAMEVLEHRPGPTPSVEIARLV